jgi:hypothetical protein
MHKESQPHLDTAEPGRLQRGQPHPAKLWAAACLFRYVVDQYEFMYGRLSDASADAIYADAARLGTTFNVRPDMQSRHLLHLLGPIGLEGNSVGRPQCVCRKLGIGVF